MSKTLAIGILEDWLKDMGYEITYRYTDLQIQCLGISRPIQEKITIKGSKVYMHSPDQYAYDLRINMPMISMAIYAIRRFSIK